ncbi:MAG: ATPase, T2SS/T4P/T4SS family [Pyrobaculum sp.]
MYKVLNKILECIECKYGCREKGLCNFNEFELKTALALASRIFKRTIDETLAVRYEFFKKVNSDMALEATLATIGLEVLTPYVQNPSVEDLLLIPGRPIYITKRGVKQKTKTLADIYHLNQLLTLAHLKRVELTTATPSFRFGIRLGPMRLRISIDIPPIVPLPQAYIRIHRRKITIRQLLDDRFISPNQLAALYGAIKEKRHIIATGPPGSGKTTLLVALDDLIPPHMQRVYIDEADEFEEEPDKNQIKIRNVNKTREIYASLNRNIDVIFIGELQYEEHFHAFKTAVEIGVQTLATMHSADMEDAIKRLAKYVELKNVAIIQLVKEGGRRNVAEIYVK